MSKIYVKQISDQRIKFRPMSIPPQSQNINQVTSS